MQRDVDVAQTEQAIHAMTNIGEDPDRAHDEANLRVKKALALGQDLEARGMHTAALVSLAYVIHALQDATSPSHAGFAEWTHRLTGMAEHLLGENFDPGPGSHLDAATMRAWALFQLPPSEWPTDFFEGITADYGPGLPADHARPKPHCECR